MVSEPSHGEGRLRPAGRSDADAIARIYTESVLAADSTMDTEPVHAPDVVRWLDRLGPRETIIVYDEDGDVLGWGIAKRYSDRPGYAVAAETSVYLDRRHLGRGLGSRLQARLMEWCREAGYHHLVAKIWADNEGSLAMHRHFGYELVGVQREIGLVGGIRRDVAILQCLLPDDR